MSARRRAAAVHATALLLMATCVGPTVRAAGFDGPQRLETLPASRWLEADAGSLGFGVARPVELLDARAGWICGVLPVQGPLQPAGALATLRAGALNELAAAVELRARGPRLAAGARLEAVQSEVAGIDRFSQLRVAANAAFLGRRAAAGARFEGPLHPSPNSAGSQLEWSAHVYGDGWAAGVARRSSRYGGPPTWRVGLRAALGHALVLAVRGGESDGELVAVLRVRAATVSVAVPVVSAVGAGAALGVSLSAGGAP
jgi:hypothetical protein